MVGAGFMPNPQLAVGSMQ